MTVIVGIDEVGRGCWAGPLVAGAVILGAPIVGLRDSKQLSRLKRQRLAGEIHRKARAIGLGRVEPWEIDEIGLTEAVRLAMQRALVQIMLPFDEIIVDGNINYFPDYMAAQAIVKADDTIPAVSAASIVAKEARDDYMRRVLHTTYPAYGFDRHVGYGTKLHQDMLRAHGVSDVHRVSFKPIQLLRAAA